MKVRNFLEGFSTRQHVPATTTAQATAFRTLAKCVCNRRKEKEKSKLASNSDKTPKHSRFVARNSVAMVWSSPTGSSSSPAEVQVCAIASTIGVDSERLVEVCQQMRQEYVVEAWQLPDLDSRQWEQLKAPIGLAVAVKHISTQRRFLSPERNVVLVQEEEKEQEVADNMMCCDDAIFPSTSLGWSSEPKEETQEKEVETKTASEENNMGFKAVQENVDEQISSVNITVVAANDPVKVEKAAEAQKSVAVVENQPYDEKDAPSVEPSEKKTGFIEEYTEWLKHVIVASTDDNEKALSPKADPPSPHDSTTLVPEIENGNNDDQLQSELDSKEEQTSIEAFDECDPSITAAFQNRVLDASDATKIPEKLALDASETTMIAHSNPEIARFDNQSDNPSSESEIITTDSKDTQRTRGRAESFDSSMEEEFSKEINEEFSSQSETMESETQTTPQQTIRSVESTESDSSSAYLEYDYKGIVKVIDDPKEYTQQAIHDDVEMEEMQDGDSDTESQINRDIFSSIPKSASFSESSEDGPEGHGGEKGKEEQGEVEAVVEEEDEEVEDYVNEVEVKEEEEEEVEDYVNLPDKESPKDEQMESAPISIIKKKETPENFSDDITVAHSNVSPEGKQSASKRRNNARIYPHEYDRGESSSSYLVETASLQNILVELPMEDHRTVLSQLLIMTNARDRVSRTNLAFQVQDTLVELIEKHQIDVDPAKAVQIIFHLSRLKKVYREMFGKSLFKAMSKLYKKSEKTERGKSSPKTKKKKGKRSTTDKESPIKDDKNTQQKDEIIETDETDGEGVQDAI